MKLDGIRERVFLDRYSLKDKAGNPIEKTPEEMWKRVAKGIASVEKPKIRAVWEKKFYDVMDGFKFLPGGRILAGAGTGYDVTYFNCFVIPSPKDSRDGILDNLKSMIEIMARGGGVGVNLSSLRPKGSRVKKVNGFSSGPINWAELYSLATHDIVQQGGCFTASTRIMTHLGLIPIEEIVMSKKDYYAATHKGFRKITAKFDNGVEDIFEVETKGGYKVRTTADHKFVTFDENGSFYQKRLVDLREGDHLVLLPSTFSNDMPEVILNTNTPIPSKFSYGRRVVSLPTTLSRELAFVIGVYLSDGSRIKDKYAFSKGFRFAVDAKRKNDLAFLIQTLKGLFGIEPIVRKGDGNVLNVEIYSRTFVEFFVLNNMLKESSNKVFVPEQIFSSPRSVVEAFIAGVFFGDGTNRGGKGGFRIISVNKKFLEDISLLLLNLGIVSKITVQKREGWQDLYTISINGSKYMKKFFEIIKDYNEKAYDNNISVRDGFYNFPINVLKRFAYLSGIQRTIAYTNPTTSSKTLMFIQNNFSTLQEQDIEDVEILTSTITDSIKTITRVGKEQVYDLEVDDVHLLSGNGFYTSNSRRGALMLMLWDWHPDIEEFITVKQDLSRINGANLSVCISDAFMDAVKKDANWDLVYPDLDEPRYDELWTGDIAAWKKAGGKVIVKKTIKAKYLWDLICTAAWRSAEPGLHFLERSNERSNTRYFEQLIATNPSLRAGTRILTKKGIFPIEQLERKRFLVKNLDGEWSEARCFLSGKNKELYKITLNNGREIYATAEHKWPVSLVGGGFGKVTTDKLRPGNILPFPKAEDLNFTVEKPLSKAEGFMVGWLYGDGWISDRRENKIEPKIFQNTSLFSNRSRVANYISPYAAVNKFSHLFPQRMSHPVLSDSDSQQSPRVVSGKRVFGFLFSEEDKILAEPILTEVNKLKKQPSSLTKARDGVYYIQATSSEFAENLASMFGVDKKENGFPLAVWQSGSEFIKGFVNGLISSDGFIAKRDYRIILTTKHKKLAEDFSSLLSFYGIKSNIRKSEATKVKFPNHKEYVKIYERYDVTIDGNNAVQFGKIFTLSHPRKQALLERTVREYTSSRALPDLELIRIKAVEKTDLKEDVWDISVYDDTHTFYINHCVTGNCGEQPLGAWAVCNLGAINLAAYVNAKGVFDYAQFAKDVQISIRFLDNVIDETYYFFDDNEKCAKDIRRTGLGILGLADALIKMKVRYGAKESLPIIKKIFATLRDNAYIASSDIAAEKGSFPKFDKKQYMKGWHIKMLPKAIQHKIVKQGIRNAVLLTIAPTGTTSLLSGVSSGIEPVYEFEYYHMGRLGKQLVYHNLYGEWKKQHPNGKRPDYFVAANDLTPENHVNVQAIAQEYIDSSISKTVNAPNSHTVEDVKKLYMLAYDHGLKGITYMRDGSRQAIFERAGDKKEGKKEDQPTGLAGLPAGRQEPKLTVFTDEPVLPRPMMVEGVTYATDSPLGKTYVTINHDQMKEPFEVFITNGKSGSDVAAMADGLGRMISLVLRLNSPVPTRERMRKVIEELIGIGGARSVGFGENRVRSLPDAVAKVLARHSAFKINGAVEDAFPKNTAAGNGKGAHGNGQTSGKSDEQAKTGIEEVVTMQQLSLDSSVDGATKASGASFTTASTSKTNLFDICPKCGTGSFAYEEGCKKCYSCGYSEC